ncbi:glutaredoxin [Sarracenia purpurea var. burkii]
MGSVIGRDGKNKEEIEMALCLYPSKTYCSYCKKVKQLLSELGATYMAIELDEESEYILIIAATTAIDTTLLCFIVETVFFQVSIMESLYYVGHCGLVSFFGKKVRKDYDLAFF